MMKKIDKDGFLDATKHWKDNNEYIIDDIDRAIWCAIADFTSFSFHAVKNFTTAEGGAATWTPKEGVENTEIYINLSNEAKQLIVLTVA